MKRSYRRNAGAPARSYRTMQAFLDPSTRLEGVFSVFAFSSSFLEDVIDKKHERDNIRVVFAEEPEALKAADATLDAPELDGLDSL